MSQAFQRACLRSGPVLSILKGTQPTVAVLVVMVVLVVPVVLLVARVVLLVVLLVFLVAPRLTVIVGHS